jgi:hypothetical protein
MQQIKDSFLSRLIGPDRTINWPQAKTRQGAISHEMLQDIKGATASMMNVKMHPKEQHVMSSYELQMAV